MVEQLWSLMPEFWQGFRVTLLLLVVSGITALVIGTLIAAMRVSPVPVLSWFAAFWTEIARNTPLTLVFFFTAFVLPMLGLRVPYLLLAFVALSYYTSPFVAEALRSGINGVPVGQAEAARSIGLGFGTTVTLVVLPQAFRMTVPPLINVFIALTKNTSVAGGFFVVELFATTRQLANDNGNIVIPILLVAAALYLVITVPLGFVAGMLEKRWVMSR
ncbi:glutamate transport system permease protein [Microbacterium halimionae]|uniref:Glutamate transport system permease protein n=1 Tax=Microbacterium halimionae TaxID=1526413 RepID=A0A7W3JP33_9MICO|nr:amino acid ABC transporter permease [Microbacterium halimionae]MBA8816422.1 glutamate transport system permease protein [Microbacterium halimionae]NII95392.1 glutamate transport system permease protein [Microbacterium halimionae]